MTCDKFQFGHVYFATPVHRELPKRVVIVIGRDKDSVQFAFVDDLRSADIDMLSCKSLGREFCKIRTQDYDYNCSCAYELPAVQAAEIYAAITSRQRR